jgi:O-antigen/teichoic acid export membrane protein
VNRDVSITLLTRGLQLASGLAATVVSARFLGPTGRGQYFFVITLTLLVVQFSNLGLPASNTYRVARDPELLGPLVVNSLFASLVVGVGAAAAAVAFLRLTNIFSTTRPILMLFALALAPAMLFFLLGTNLLVGSGRIRVFNAFELAGNALVMGALVAAGLLAPRVSAFLTASTVAWAAVAGALALFLLRRSRGPRGFRADVFRAGLRYSAKAYLAALLSFVVLRGNVFLLQRFAFEQELGWYSVAAQVADALAILPATIALVLFPRLVRDAAGRLHATLRTALVTGALLALLCVVAAFAAGPVISFVFGADFEPAARILRWMLPGVVAFGVLTVLSQFLAALGMPKALVGIWGLAAAVALVLGRFLIAPYHAVGAAATLSITYGLTLVLVGALVVRHGRAERPAEEPRGPAPLPEWVETPGA